MEWLEDILIAVLYIIAAVIIAKLYVYVNVKKIEDKVRIEHQEDSDLTKYIRPMMHYMKVKGIDDFVFDCKRWQRKGYITIEARAMLNERYKALGDLGANGERDAAFNAIKALEPREE